jgi:hypothetical protein
LHTALFRQTCQSPLGVGAHIITRIIKHQVSAAGIRFSVDKTSATSRSTRHGRATITSTASSPAGLRRSSRSPHLQQLSAGRQVLQGAPERPLLQPHAQQDQHCLPHAAAARQRERRLELEPCACSPVHTHAVCAAFLFHRQSVSCSALAPPLASRASHGHPPCEIGL